MHACIHAYKAAQRACTDSTSITLLVPINRFRPLKTGCASIQDDQLTKLAAFDFPLNDANNGGCRPIELERPVAEYPVVVAAMEQLYSRLYGPRRRL